MPTLKHLLEELKLIGAQPDDVRIPARLYDDIVTDAEETSENPEEED